MTRTLVFLALAALVLVAACGDESDPFTTRTPSPTKADTVLANCQILATALDSFALENNGEYPRHLGEQSLGGHTLIEFLPEDRWLLNPYTGNHIEPREIDSPVPGRIDYEPAVELDWSIDQREWPALGFVVTGHGEDSVIVRITAGPDSLTARNPLVIANCYLVRDAVELFASRNDDAYPSDLTDRDSNGDTMVDLLPGERLLDNPYTLLATEPLSAEAAQSGQTGYIAVFGTGGFATGYVISGWGWWDKIITIVKE